MNVSERMVYMAKELSAAGRPDLVTEVNAGRMKLLAVLKLAKPWKYAKPRNGEKALRDAWTKATEDERDAFAAWLEAQVNSNTANNAVVT